MAESLRAQAQLRPDARAFAFLERGECEAGVLTYSALDARAAAIAATLLDQGLQGQRVILAYPTGLEFVAALFGCFYAGVTAVPAPFATRGYGLGRLNTIAVDAQVAAILSLRSALDALGGLPAAFRIATDEITTGAAYDPAGPGGLALLQYTSGSTGQPRGVILSHANIMANQKVLAAALRAKPGEVAVSWLPLYHDMGLVGGVLHAVHAAGSCVLMPPLAFLQLPSRWLAAISHYRASVSMAPCFAYRLCAERAVPAGLDLAAWRVAICGGEPINPVAFELFVDRFRPSGFNPAALMPAYGLAEATLMVTAARRLSEAPPSNRRLVSCGKVPALHRLAIVDPATQTARPGGQTGEIWLAGPSIAAGYWNRPDDDSFRSRLAGAPGEWLRTGDLGFLGPGGLVVTGRAKETIIIRGTNYDPLDLEAAACAAEPALAPGGGGAFGLELPSGEAVVLVQEVQRQALSGFDADIAAGRVIGAISRCFGLTIHDLVLLRPGTLPRTTSGKIQRHLCREQYLTGRLATLPIAEHPGLGRCRPGSSAA